MKRFAKSTCAALALAVSSIAFAADTPADALEWRYVPGISKPIEMAVVSGDPAADGPYVVRYRMPSGMKMNPQRFSDERQLTVIKGIFWISGGESFNWKDMDEFKQGAVILKEANKPYFGWARTAVILEERGVGPSKFEYVHEEDDPRNRRARIDN